MKKKKVIERPAVSGNEVYYIITDGPEKVETGKEVTFQTKQLLGLDNAIRLSEERHDGKLFLAVDAFLKKGEHIGEPAEFSFEPFQCDNFTFNEQGLVISHPFHEVFYLPSRKQGILVYIG